MVRRRLALVACVLWLLGVEVLPAVHQGMHASLEPHRHDAGGMIVTVTFDEPAHRHADGSVHAHHGTAPVTNRDTRNRLRDPSSHAAGLAHHAEALIAVAPPLSAPIPIDRRPTSVVPLPIRILSSATVPEAAARGPPVRAS